METSDAIPDGGEVRFKVAGGGEACVGRGGRIEKRMERTDVFYETESEGFSSGRDIEGSGGVAILRRTPGMGVHVEGGNA